MRDNVKRIPSEKLDKLQIGLPEGNNVKNDTAPAEQLDDSTVKTSNISNKEPNFSGESPSTKAVKKFTRSIITRSMKRIFRVAIKNKHDEINKALEGPEQRDWIQSMLSEVDSLINKTQTLIPERPSPNEEYDIVGSRMALKKKMKDVGKLDKYKSRLCVRGDQLSRKKNYDPETYSPTVAALTHTTLLQLSINDQMHLASFDTIGAYLYQQNPQDGRKLYIRLPRNVAIACGLDPEQLLGKLLYLYTSRPDIITALSYAATLNIAPTIDDYNELLEIVGFLKKTRNRGLTFSTPSTNDNQLRLICYVDAAYMSNDDASSHTGYTISLGSEPNPMSFYHSKSKKQKLIATSSNHAEIRALYELKITTYYFLDEHV